MKRFGGADAEAGRGLSARIEDHGAQHVSGRFRNQVRFCGAAGLREAAGTFVKRFNGQWRPEKSGRSILRTRRSRS